MLKVVCAVVYNEHKFLITQLPPDCSRALEWEFPGGKINPGEDAVDAVMREISEELSIEINIVEAMTAVIHTDGEKDFELIPYLCKIQSGKIRLIEHSQMRWVNYNELEMLKLSAADKQLIQHPDNQLILKKYSGKDMHNPC